MSPEARASALRWAGFALLAVLVLAAWANGLQGEFTYDDKVEVVGNRTIRTLEDWHLVLAYNASRPVVILSWALDWRLWGLSPAGYHAVNLLVHLLNAGLVLLLGEEVLRRLGWRAPLLPALAAAALWAVHPMTTEAVTYITGRSEALCATFYLGAVLEWLRWRREGGGFHLFLAFLAFLLAAATKEVAATIPPMILLMELGLPSERPLGRRGLLALAPFWLSLLAGAWLRKALYGVFITDQWLRPLQVQLATELEVIVRYLQLWLLPVGQSVFHDHPPAPGLLHWQPLLCLGLLCVAAAVAIQQRRRRPWLLVCAGWFLLVLLPSSSFVPLKETMAEHRTYLAGWGLCLAAVLVVAPLAARRWGLALGLVAALVLALATATHLRNRAWASEVALWAQAVDRNPASAEAWYGYADALRFAKEFDRAVIAYREAVELDNLFLDAWNNLGIALAEQGKAAEAREVWLETLQRHPSYCRAHNNLGWLYFRQRRWESALAEFRTTLSYCAGNTQAHFAMGNIYFGPRRDARRAVYHYQQVIDLDPAFPERELIKERLLQLTF